ncbi:ribosomal protein L7/L12 [Streptomyces sp. NPDC092370]|uniref:ribosomal protein L7/L12 n=1 Tax=Streptomyces sp. NPDC092370 TaxID=3366016 RepID=UPI003811377C
MSAAPAVNNGAVVALESSRIAVCCTTITAQGRQKAPTRHSPHLPSRPVSCRAAASAPEKPWLPSSRAHTLPFAEAGGEMSDEESTEYYMLLCDDPSHEVVLVDCGPREMDVILAVRKVTGQSLWHSRVLARQAPVTLLGGLSAYRAQSAVALLQSAGAGAEWRQEPEPGERTAPSP